MKLLIQIPCYNEQDQLKRIIDDIRSNVNDFSYDILIIDDGSSIADLSRKTHIPYYSLYNTFKKVRQKLKRLL